MITPGDPDSFPCLRPSEAPSWEERAYEERERARRGQSLRQWLACVFLAVIAVQLGLILRRMPPTAGELSEDFAGQLRDRIPVVTLDSSRLQSVVVDSIPAVEIEGDVEVRTGVLPLEIKGEVKVDTEASPLDVRIQR